MWGWSLCVDSTQRRTSVTEICYEHSRGKGAFCSADFYGFLLASDTRSKGHISSRATHGVLDRGPTSTVLLHAFGYELLGRTRAQTFLVEPVRERLTE